MEQSVKNIHSYYKKLINYKEILREKGYRGFDIVPVKENKIIKDKNKKICQ